MAVALRLVLALAVSLRAGAMNFTVSGRLLAGGAGSTCGTAGTAADFLGEPVDVATGAAGDWDRRRRKETSQVGRFTKQDSCRLLLDLLVAKDFATTPGCYLRCVTGHRVSSIRSCVLQRPSN